MARPITFLSDYGYEDEFAGVCRALIARIAPDARLIDITHGIPRHDVRRGAVSLLDALPHTPAGIHLAVVDPGVGTDRKALVLRDGSGRIYVGPDNGLLVPAAERNGGVAEVYELANREYALPEISRTFHGRDVFAPAAAHLALGVEPSALGPPVAAGDLVRIRVPQPEVGHERVTATVLYVDSFGNVQLNLTQEQLEGVGIEPGASVELVRGVDRYYAKAARTFADARQGDLILYVDAYRNVSLAISGGDAAALLAARPGERIRILLRPGE